MDYLALETLPAVAPGQGRHQGVPDLALAVARHNNFSGPRSLMDMAQGLEALYARFNHRRYVHPDPLEFLYHYPEPAEREIVGLICACLAYGRVSQILKAIRTCLDIMDRQPKTFLMESGELEIQRAFSGFCHRFTKGKEMGQFLIGIKRGLLEYGSLEAIFSDNYTPGDEPDPQLGLIDQLSRFVDRLKGLAGLERSYLLPNPRKKSACKRLFLYLRWMVRRDDVDPGGWSCLHPSALVVPLDTHMFNIAKDLGLTLRRSPDLGSALEVTRAFREISPKDPVKYDFVLTRFGIRQELSRLDVPELVYGLTK